MRQVYLEGGATNLQVGIEEVMSYKTKVKSTIIWTLAALKMPENSNANANININGG